MNLSIMCEHLSKLEIIVCKKLNAERSKIFGNSHGNFSKDIFPGITVNSRMGIPGGIEWTTPIAKVIKFLNCAKCFDSGHLQCVLRQGLPRPFPH